MTRKMRSQRFVGNVSYISPFIQSKVQRKTTRIICKFELLCSYFYFQALALLSHPFICKTHPEMEGQIKKHFLFSVELLARLVSGRNSTKETNTLANSVPRISSFYLTNF